MAPADKIRGVRRDRKGDVALDAVQAIWPAMEGYSLVVAESQDWRRGGLVAGGPGFLKPTLRKPAQRSGSRGANPTLRNRPSNDAPIAFGQQR